MGPSKYMSVATAELDPDQNAGDWVDPRVQMLDTGARVFKSHTRCIDELFDEVKELIDALRR